jgi:hypothetical protein
MLGEWTVAERFTVYRGEYVGRTQRVELPVWSYTREKFVIAADTTTKKRMPGIGVYFGFEAEGNDDTPPEPIVVDFEPGQHRHDRYVQKGEKVEAHTVVDSAGTEVLLFTPEGKLRLLEEANDDVQDRTRVQCLKAVRARIQEVKAAGGGE